MKNDEITKYADKASAKIAAALKEFMKDTDGSVLTVEVSSVAVIEKGNVINIKQNWDLTKKSTKASRGGGICLYD